MVPRSICHPTLSSLICGTSLVLVGTGACDHRVGQGRTRLWGMSYKSAWGQLRIQCCRVEISWNWEPQDMNCSPSSTLAPVWTLSTMGVCFLICKIYILDRSSFWTQDKSVPHLGFSFSHVLFKKWCQIRGSLKPDWIRESPPSTGPCQKKTHCTQSWWNTFGSSNARRRFNMHLSSNFENALSWVPGLMH